jgi:hypothetical protein
MSAMPVLTDSRVRVARDLRAIAQMEMQMIEQAVNDANSTLMPGGLAMVALANVANQEAFANLIDAAETRAIKLAKRYELDPADLMPAIEDDDWEPPLQTLCFWSEAWRAELDMVADFRPTVTTESNFLRWAAEWAWSNEPKWDDFVRDVGKARARLEAILSEGQRPVARGVSCMYDECRGARLIRTTVPAADKDGNKIWRLTDWHCPRCKRSWDEESYQRHVYAAIHRAKTYIAATDHGTEVWCTVDVAAKRVSRPQSTIRVWLHRHQISEVCVLAQRRWSYVLLADVEERDRQARERWAKQQAARLARGKGSEAVA